MQTAAANEFLTIYQPLNHIHSTATQPEGEEMRWLIHPDALSNLQNGGAADAVQLTQSANRGAILLGNLAERIALSYPMDCTRSR